MIRNLGYLAAGVDVALVVTGMLVRMEHRENEQHETA